MSMSRSEAREEAYYARQDRNAGRCQCGSPDWPGSCPGSNSQGEKKSEGEKADD